MPSQDPDQADRVEDAAVAELAARVARIEQHLGLGRDGREDDAHDSADQSTDPAGSTAGPTAAAGTWWLLDELERRRQEAVAYGGRARDAAGGPVHWQITHGSDALLQADWSEAAGPLAALGHPSRLQILQLVARGEARTAAELAGAEGLGTTGQIYHHLRQLVAAGWLRPGARGQHQVPAERLVPLLVLLSAAGVLPSG
jgi:DNA-binding transcriptional ArsR family regulator